MFVLKFWFFRVSKIGGAINKMSGGSKMMVVSGEKEIIWTFYVKNVYVCVCV